MSTFKTLRKEKGLTQTELAKLLKIDQTTVSKWELGKALPDTALLIKLAEFFDVSIDFLLSRTEFYYPDKVTIATPIGESLTSEELELLSLFRELSPYLKGMTLDVVRSWAKKDTDGERKKV